MSEHFISAVGVPTCNRPEAVRRSLGSYLENFQRSARSVTVTVVDDSQSAQTRSEYRRALAEHAARYNAAVHYAGLEEKLRFLKKLLAVKAASLEILKFAFFDSEQTGLATYGGNRNFLLLAHCGERFVTVDDDTVCRISRPARQGQGFAIASDSRFSSSHPCHCRVYPTLEEMLSQLEFIEADFLGLHEMMLGRNVGDAISHIAKVSSTDCGAANSDVMALIREGRRILITFNGLAGDCATPSPTNYLLFDGESLNEFIADEQRYSQLILSRQIERAPLQFIISRRTSNTPGLFTGFDNRQFLPPYVPVGRGEDLVFWNALERTNQSVAFGYLPWSALHLPIDLRTFWPGEIGRSASGISLDVFLSSLIRSWRDATAGSPEKRLRGLGEYFRGISSLGAEEFDRFTSAEADLEMDAFVEQLERILAEHPDGNAQWKKHHEQFICTARNTRRDHPISIPLDILYGRSMSEARDLAQKLIGRIGDLFMHWPGIVDAARELKRKGHFLAQPVKEAA